MKIKIKIDFKNKDKNNTDSNFIYKKLIKVLL